MSRSRLLPCLILPLLAACGSGGASAPAPLASATPAPAPAPVPVVAAPPLPKLPATPRPSVVRVANIGGAAYAGASLAASSQIVLGEGAVVGAFGPHDVREDLQDWGPETVKGIDAAGDATLYNDGFDDSRDIAAVCVAEGADELYIRLDLADLAYGAESGNLDIAVLFDWRAGGQTQLPDMAGWTTAQGYECVVRIFDALNFQIMDEGFNVLADAQSNASAFLGLNIRADLDGLEFGISKDVLRNLGWTGPQLPLLQVYTVKDWQTEPADAHLELDLSDGVLNEQVDPRWTAGAAKLASIAVGNRPCAQADVFKALLQGNSSSAGTPAGLARLLEAHGALGAPLNLHASAAFLLGLNWAADADPAKDGPALVSALRAQVQSGAVSILPGTIADHPVPFFENAATGGANDELRRLNDELLAQLLGPTSSQVFWAGERVLSGSSLLDVYLGANGSPTATRFTVIDQLTHLNDWYGMADASDPVIPFKVQRINNVGCFVVQDRPNALLLQPEDGGAHRELRQLLWAKALDADQDQVIVTAQDWERLCGAQDPELADRYFSTLRWLANKPWIEVVSLDEVARRGWTEVARPVDVTLPVASSDWLHHATQMDYASWFYGSSMEESFAGVVPELRPGAAHALPLGDAATRGTLLGEAWFEARNAPGELGRLARIAYGAALYRAAWHDEDSHDLSRDALGQYDKPDLTPDDLSAFAYAHAARAGDAVVIARAAAWAASAGPISPQALIEDVDLDGEGEMLLVNESLYAVFERDGGRLEALFVRDALTGEAHLVVGNPLSAPGERPSIEHEGADNGSAQRHSFLKDWWLSSPGTNQYVNDLYSAQPLSSGAGWSFTSSDGAILKTVSLAGDRIEVSYTLDPSAGTLYLRGSASPALRHLIVGGPAALSVTDDGQVASYVTRAATRDVALVIRYADAGHSAQLNGLASDGSSSSPRNIAFSQMVELSGSGSFAFAIGAELR